MTKPLAIAFFLALLACLACRPAAAAPSERPVEYCPTEILGSHRFEDSAGALYSFDLHGGSARTVSGTIVAQTDAGWFSIPFSSVTLVPDNGRYRNDNVSFTRNDFVSAALYVSFPPGVTKIERWWVDRAQTAGESVYGWDAHGVVDCLPPAGVGLRPPSAGERIADLVSPPVTNLQAAPDSKDSVIAAAPRADPGNESCAQPFVSARVRHAAQPRWPMGWTISKPL